MDIKMKTSGVQKSPKRKTISNNFNNSFKSPINGEISEFKKPFDVNESFKWKVRLRSKYDKDLITKRKKKVQSKPLASSSFRKDSPESSTVLDPQLSSIGQCDDGNSVSETIAKSRSPEKSIDESQFCPFSASSVTDDSEPIVRSRSPSIDLSLSIDESEPITNVIEMSEPITPIKVDIANPITAIVEPKKSVFPPLFIRASELISSDKLPCDDTEQMTKRSVDVFESISPKTPRKHSTPKKSIVGDSDVSSGKLQSPKTPKEHQTPKNSIGDDSDQSSSIKHPSPGDVSESIISPKTLKRHQTPIKPVGDDSDQSSSRNHRSPDVKPMKPISELISPKKPKTPENPDTSEPMTLLSFSDVSKISLSLKSYRRKSETETPKRESNPAGKSVDQDSHGEVSDLSKMEEESHHKTDEAIESEDISIVEELSLKKTVFDKSAETEDQIDSPKMKTHPKLCDQSKGMDTLSKPRTAENDTKSDSPKKERQNRQIIEPNQNEDNEGISNKQSEDIEDAFSEPRNDGRRDSPKKKRRNRQAIKPIDIEDNDDTSIHPSEDFEDALSGLAENQDGSNSPKKKGRNRQKIIEANQRKDNEDTSTQEDVLCEPRTAENAVGRDSPKKKRRNCRVISPNQSDNNVDTSTHHSDDIEDALGQPRTAENEDSEDTFTHQSEYALSQPRTAENDGRRDSPKKNRPNQVMEPNQSEDNEGTSTHHSDNTEDALGLPRTAENDVKSKSKKKKRNRQVIEPNQNEDNEGISNKQSEDIEDAFSEPRSDGRRDSPKKKRRNRQAIKSIDIEDNEDTSIHQGEDIEDALGQPSTAENDAKSNSQKKKRRNHQVYSPNQSEENEGTSTLHSEDNEGTSTLHSEDTEDALGPPRTAENEDSEDTFTHQSEDALSQPRTAENDGRRDSPKKNRRNRQVMEPNQSEDNQSTSTHHSDNTEGALGLPRSAENDDKSESKKKRRNRQVISPNQSDNYEDTSTHHSEDIDALGLPRTAENDVKRKTKKKKRNRQFIEPNQNEVNEDTSTHQSEDIEDVLSPPRPAENDGRKDSSKKKMRNRQKANEPNQVEHLSQQKPAESAESDSPEKNRNNPTQSEDEGSISAENADKSDSLKKRKRNRHAPSEDISRPSPAETPDLIFSPKKKRNRKHDETLSEDISVSPDNEDLPKKKKRRRFDRTHSEIEDSSPSPAENEITLFNQDRSDSSQKKRKHIKLTQSEENSDIDSPPLEKGSDSPKKRTQIETFEPRKKKSHFGIDSDGNYYLGSQHYAFGTDHYSMYVNCGHYADVEDYPTRWLAENGFQSLNKNVIEEIKQFLELDKKLFKKLKHLDIKIDWKIPKVHLLCLNFGRDTKGIQEFVKENQFSFKTGKFRKKEDSIIMSNWKKFCELYDFDENDYAPFLPLFRYAISPLTKLQKVRFRLFLAQGLNRSSQTVYERFVTLNKYFKTGRFTSKEDKIIKYFWRKVPRKFFYSVCSFVLNRSRSGIYQHSKLIIPDLGGDGIRTNEGIEFRQGKDEEKIGRDLFKKCSKYSPERLNLGLSHAKMKKIAKKNDCSSLQVSKMFYLKLQPMLASKEKITRSDLRVRIIELMNEYGYNTWSAVDWVRISKNINNLGPLFIYSEFRKIVKRFVPHIKRRLLSTVMTFLNTIIDDIESVDSDKVLKPLP